MWFCASSRISRLEGAYLAKPVTPQNQNVLSQDQLASRFDFSLLALQCAWREPWTPDSHPTFQPGLRTAVRQVALCLQRAHLPRELHGHIVQYFSRDWWPDNRACCWNYDCQLDQMRKREACADTGEEYKPPSLKFCDCGVALYCSRACRDADMKDGHRRFCGRPPMCRPTAQEYRFCDVIRRTINPGSEDEVMEESTDHDKDEIVVDADDDDDDDDDDWESVDSDEESDESSDATRDATSQILNFFQSRHK